MSAASGFKRLGIGLAAVVAAGVGGLVAMSWLVPAERVRTAVIAEIQSATGLDPVIRGDVAVSFFPSGLVTFNDVVLADDRPGTPALAAAQLTARLRLLPLLFGRVEAADVSLVRPGIVVAFDREGRSNWSGLVEKLARTLKPGAARSDRPMSFSEIRVTGGTLTLRDDARGIAETLSNVEMSLAWPAISKSFAAIGRFSWRGEWVDGSVSLSDLAAALEGERSGLKLRLAGAPLKLAFEGHLTHRSTLRVDGTLAADAASLREALRWAGQTPPPGGGFDRFALKAQTRIAAGTVALSGVNIELDGNAAEGVLTFTTGARPSVQGTLAAEVVDFTPYVSTVQLLRGSERHWSRLPIRLDGLADYDLDLRLSAARIQLANARLGRTAVAANLRNGELTVTVGESQAFGGVLKGSVGLARAEAGAQVRAQLLFAEVDLESCLGELFGLRRLEGKGNLALTLGAGGGSVYALTRTLNGTAALAGRQGAITGLNVEQLLRRLERRPLSGGAEFRSGRTPFDRLAVSLRIVDGTATIEDVQLEGTAVRLVLAGSASIPARDLDLKGTASLVQAAAGEGAAGFELPFVVQGPWDDPIMLPDAQILIKRSGAAAPLLDAVRDRRTRDAVRSAIERITGAPPPAVDPPAAGTPPAQ